MAVTIQTRRDSAVDWTDANPVLALGEIGIEVDTNSAKYGDGFTRWADLPYWIVDSASIIAHLADDTIHFTEAEIDHANILNIGSNDHAAIDTHIADASIHQPIQAARKNLLINGGMDIWQRGTGPTAGATYVADRWTSGVAQMTQERVAEDGGYVNKASISGGTAVQYTQPIELNKAGEAYPFNVGQTLTLSVRAKWPVGETINVNTIWRDTSAGGNQQNDQVAQAMGVGTGAYEDYTFTWNVSAGPVATNTCYLVLIENNGATTGVDHFLSSAQLELGPEATDFEYRPIAEELALCQRYYHTTRRDGFSNNDRGWEGVGTAYLTTNLDAQRVEFPVAMRIPPSITYHSTEGGLTNNLWHYYRDSQWLNASSMQNGVISNIGWKPRLIVSGAVIENAYLISGNYEADAEL
jgi:hypothetical protein